MPWGFQPPKGFVLPRYVPRRPASVPTPKQLGYTMPGGWVGWAGLGCDWRRLGWWCASSS